MKIHIWLVLILALFLVACSGEKLPDASLFVEPHSVKLDGNQTSDFVTITVTRNNQGNVSTPFVIEFGQKTEVYPVDIETGEQITQLTTRSLIDKKQKDTLQFRIKAMDREEPTYSEYDIPLTLMWGSSVLDTKTITVKVTYS